jgi:uncharacterized phiE125 gp8 family phage protein
MKRAIIAPPALAPAALDELKQWLAITTTGEDAALGALLLAALETCEAFTGLMPLEATCEEVLPAGTCWRALQTRPVQAVTGIEGIPPEGARFALAAEDYAIDLDADGGAHVRVIRRGAAGRIAVRFVAGLAPDWASLPDGLRQGAIRLAADAYRRRDGESQGRQPPAAVAALWRPWRRMRVA